MPTKVKDGRHLSRPAQALAMNERRQAVLDFMFTYSGQHGLPPAMREISAAVGGKSTFIIRRDLLALAEAGCLLYSDNEARPARLPLEQQWLAIARHLEGQGVDLLRLLQQGRLA